MNRTDHFAYQSVGSRVVIVIFKGDFTLYSARVNAYLHENHY